MQSSIITWLSFRNNAEEAICIHVEPFNIAFGSENRGAKDFENYLFGEKELKDILNVPDVPKEMMPDSIPARQLAEARFH